MKNIIHDGSSWKNLVHDYCINKENNYNEKKKKHELSCEKKGLIYSKLHLLC